MITNFFSQLVQLGFRETDINIKHVDGKLHIAISRKSTSDDESTNIPALRLKGTVEEMDLEFFDTIQKPLNTSDAFMTNIEDYEKNLEAAKKSSKMNEEENKKKKDKANNLKSKAEKMAKDEDRNVTKIIECYEDAAKLFEDLKMKSEAKECLESVSNLRKECNIAETKSLF